MTVAVQPDSIPADGSAVATVTAKVADAGGNPVVGDQVVFSSSDPGQRLGSGPRPRRRQLRGRGDRLQQRRRRHDRRHSIPGRSRRLRGTRRCARWPWSSSSGSGPGRGATRDAFLDSAPRTRHGRCLPSISSPGRAIVTHDRRPTFRFASQPGTQAPVQARRPSLPCLCVAADAPPTLPRCAHLPGAQRGGPTRARFLLRIHRQASSPRALSARLSTRRPPPFRVTRALQLPPGLARTLAAGRGLPST